MRTLVVLTGLLTVLAVAAPKAMAASDSTAATVTVHKSAYGGILFDGRGFVLYAFTHDRRGRNTCTSACAKAWPPYLINGVPQAGSGAKASLLGTIRRSDGRLQATYGGRPLYFYVGDRKPGQILCQNVSEFGGLWLVVRADGRPVR